MIEPRTAAAPEEITAGRGRSQAHQPGRGLLPTSLTPWLVFLVAVLWHSADRLIIPPLNRLLEANICRVYYREHDPSVIDSHDQVPEYLCKGSSIQIQLALLLGCIQTIGLACELLSTLPLGYASDKFGRKTILYINLVCMASGYGWAMIVGYWYDTFSVNATIAAPFLYLLGGYVNVTSTNLLAIIADVSDDDVHRVDPSAVGLYRTTMFGYFRSAHQVTRLIAPTLAAFTMSFNLWIPFWIGMGAYLIALPVVSLFPDTRKHVFKAGETQPLLPTEDASDNVDVDVDIVSEPLNSIFLYKFLLRASVPTWSSGNSPPPKDRSSPRDLISRGSHQIKSEIHDYVKLFRSSRNITLCLLIFLVTSLSDNNLNVLLQYASKRYGWTISQAAYLFSLKAGVNVILYTLIVPLGLKQLKYSWGLSSIYANLWAEKSSILLLCLGSLAIGLSFNIGLLIPSLVFYSLGWGISVFNLCLLTYAAFEVLDEEHTGRIYSVMGFFETLGSLIGVPLMTGTWALGIKIGGFGLGLPFFVCAGMYFAATIIVWFLRFK